VLDEVERFADRILVIVNGKLAAAGNFHTIRDRMDEQASQIRVRASDPRRFAAALIRELCVQGVVISGADSERPWIRVEAADVRRFYGSIARLAQQEDVTLYEVTALDDSLASVFAYVVGR
jgi:ABC-2 type transport system ATP-binding protein